MDNNKFWQAHFQSGTDIAKYSHMQDALTENPRWREHIYLKARLYLSLLIFMLQKVYMVVMQSFTTMEV